MSPTETAESPRVLVTGASSGIGAAVAADFAAASYEVHVVARRADRLDRLAAAINCVAHVLDVRDSDRLNALIGEIGPLDVLVNNAGLARLDGALAESTIDDLTVSIDTNVTAVLVATKAALPAMIDRGRGHIVNVGSMMGLYPLAGASYGASKAAIHRLSTNLRLELRGTGIRVTEICPGRVATEFYDVAVTDPERRAGFGSAGVEELTPEDIAGAVRYAVEAPARVNVNRIELQPTGQTYGGSQFDPVERRGTGTSNVGSREPSTREA